MELVKELVEVRTLLKKLKEKEESLIDHLKADEDFEKYSDDKVNVYKSVRRTVELKEGIDKEDAMRLFPKAIKESLDMKVLREIPEAHELMEMKETEVLTVKIK